jgi:hypothetical protein
LEKKQGLKTKARDNYNQNQKPLRQSSKEKFHIIPVLFSARHLVEWPALNWWLGLRANVKAR